MQLSNQLLQKLNTLRPKEEEQLTNVVQDWLDIKRVLPEEIDQTNNRKVGANGEHKSRYEGQVNKKGQWHGYGKYTDDVGLGRREEGYWKNGLKHGQAIEICHDGQTYEGEWYKGLREGQGTLIEANGVRYIGQWRHGKFHGQGTLFYTDEEKFIGEFKEGRPWKGYGTYIFENNFKYKGFFDYGRPHGHCIEISPNGKTFIGEWKEGVRLENKKIDDTQIKEAYKRRIMIG